MDDSARTVPGRAPHAMESEDPPPCSFSQCVERVGSGVCIVGGSGLRAWRLCLEAVLKSAGSPDLVPLVCLGECMSLLSTHTHR